MGMGMAEGEWAAKRGLPGLSQAGRTLAASEVGLGQPRRSDKGRWSPKKAPRSVSILSSSSPFLPNSTPSSLLPAAWMFSNTWFFSFPHLGFSGGGGSCS